MSTITENMLTVSFCPACAKQGRERVQVGPTRYPEPNFVCRACGWMGPPERSQQYSYPCKMYKTVEMEIPVLLNMWESLKPPTTEKEIPFDPKQVQVPYFIDARCKVSPAEVAWVGMALDYLVTKKFLPVAHYKLTVRDSSQC